MPSEQFAQAVRGSGTQPIQTNAQGTMETDNYGNGGDFAAGGETGNTFPFPINPAALMQEVTFTEAGKHVAEFHLTGGDVVELRLEDAVGVWDKWETDKLVLRDPKGNGNLICGGWAGE